MRMGIAKAFHRCLVLALALILLPVPTFLTSGLASGASSSSASVDLGSTGMYTPGTSTYQWFTNTSVVEFTVRKVVTGDFNSDGRQDLAVIYYQKAFFDIFYQTTDGNYSSTNSIRRTPGQVLTDIAAADMDYDHKDDVVVCYSTSPTAGAISFYFQNHTFNTTKVLTTARNPQAIAIGDFDKDGLNDLAYTRTLDSSPVGNSRLNICLNSTDFFPTDIPLGAAVGKVNLLVVCDFDSDGQPDLVMADTQNSIFLAYRNANPLLEDWPLTLSITIQKPVSIDVMDLGTTYPAIMMASNGNGMIYMYQWTGSVLSGGTKSEAISGLSYAKAVDLNSDGLSDIVAVSDVSNNVSYYYTTSSNPSYFGAAGTFPCQEHAIQLLAARINDDLTFDLLVIQNRSAIQGAVTIVYNVGGSLGNANDNIGTGYAADSLIIGNFTQMFQSIGYLNKQSSKLCFLENGKWYFRSVASIKSVLVASLSDPRYQDLVYIDSSASFNVISHSSGTGFYTNTATNYPLALTNPSSIDAVLWNSDSYYDLVIGCNGGFQVFLNDGTGHFTAGSAYSFTKCNFSLLTSSDYDVWRESNTPQPARCDVAVVNSTGKGITVFFQQSGASFNWASGNAENISLPSYVAGTIIWMDSADLTGDGRTDLVIGTSDGYVIVYPQGDFATGFNADTSLFVKRMEGGFSSGTIGDYDDDGKAELVVVGSHASLVTMFEVTLSGFTTSYHQTGGAGASFLAIGDVNGDKLPDLAVSSNGSKAISVFYEMNRPPTASFVRSVGIPTEGIAFTVDSSSSTDTVSDLPRLRYSYQVQYNQTGLWVEIAAASTVTVRQLTFAANGTHLLKMVVTDPGGLSSSVIQTVRVYDSGPTAAFTSPTGTEGALVQFIDSSTYIRDAITSWSWNFGDGTALDTRKNPTHVFSWNATYHVTLTVSDRDGNTSIISHDVIIADALPTAAFACSATSISEGGSITFDASPSTSVVDHIVSYSWTFENGTYSSSGTNPVVSHQFLTRGVYWINLTVMENDTGKAWLNRTIVVQDRVPSVTFTPSTATIDEGDTVNFQATVTDSPYDRVVQYIWSFGDGQTSAQSSPSHRYTVHRTYIVTLTVVDQDGSTASFEGTIIVQDTNPTVGQITTTVSATSFPLGSNVTFRVPVTAGFETPSYLWTVSTSTGQIVQMATTVPSFYYSFSAAGSYHLLLRVNDSDFQTERTFDLSIIDHPPVISLECTGIDLASLTIYVSANGTSDPDIAAEVLQYSWNFGDGDGWTPYSSEKVWNWHRFATPGIHNVTVKVKDQGNEVLKTISVVLDKGAPIIALANQVSKAYIGDSILIVAHISEDISYNATLYYSYDGENFTYSVRMVPVDQNGNVSALIPAQTNTCTIWYKIVAVDANNNVGDIQPIELVVELRPDQTMWLLVSGALLIVIIALLIYLWVTRPVVDEVFIIYHDGNLIAHQARRLKPGMDDQILGSMLVALQNFVKDSFKDEQTTHLKRMDFGEKKLMVEKSEFIYIAVVLNGSRTGKVPAKLEKVIKSIDENYGIELIAWDGDLEKLRGMKEETQPLFERGSIRDKFNVNGRKTKANGRT
ncbi:MAG: PKD domain protein [Methanomassiliicoccales archaeon PtaU1.Bin124]|nr:MAG: PKD domain protein [Methanomassiliicoccales archaeon PtaU1.Bin124]